MPLNVGAIYGIANHFRAQHLQKLQFPGSNKSTPARGRKQAAPKATGPQTSGDAHFDAVMSRSADLLARTAPATVQRPEDQAFNKETNRQRGRDFGVHVAQDRANVAGAHRDLAASFDTAKQEIHRSHMSRVGKSVPAESLRTSAPAASGEWNTHPIARDVQMSSRSTSNPDGSRGPRKIAVRPKPGGASTPAAPAPAPAASKPAPSAPAAPAKPAPAAPRVPSDGSGSHSFYNQNEDTGWTSQVGAYKPAGNITPDGPLKPVVTAPVKSAAQFTQPKKSDYRQAAGPAAPRPSRTYHAPEPTPFTPPAGGPAPAKTPWNPAWDNSTHWSSSLPSRDEPTAAPAKQTRARTPRAKKAAAPAAEKESSAPAKPTVSDSEWNTMLNDSVKERQVRKGKAAEPAPAPSGPKNFRETTLKKNGQEHVIRTEHNGTQKQLEAKHTKAVKAFLGATYAPDVAEAQARVAHSEASNAKKSIITANKSELAKAKRKAAGHDHATPKEANRAYGTKKQLSMFEGDGPDDPNLSHEYGIKKK
jgi:hypothetical protein